jgi:predicted nuclease with TOPRIM domain
LKGKNGMIQNKLDLATETIEQIKRLCGEALIDESDRDLRRIVQAISWHKQYEDVKDSLQSNCLGNTELIKKFAIESGFLYLDVVEDAIMQTNKIASLCNAELETPERRIPIFDKHDKLDELFEVIEW